jgi:alginate O-acetyltransferase complex protein AlgI
MSFISWQYLIFLPLIILLYWQLPHKGRLLLLLAGSYFFYGCWDVRFLALVLATTCIDYVAALSVDGQRTPPGRVLLLALIPAAWISGCYLALPHYGIRLAVPAVAVGLGLAFFALHEAIWRLSPESGRPRFFLILSIVFCLTILGFFKYFGFFVDSAKSLLRLTGLNANWTTLQIILPVGISFYTFQSLGYVIDVYRRVSPACQSFLTFATFDAFFPQMVSGPIERGKSLIPQLQAERSFRETYVQDGLIMILVGFFKKVFVADNCAILASYVFDNRTPLNAYWAILGVVAFTFQIYGDFSGYTDIARGSAKLLGIDLMQNFRFPYVARNPSDFWGRWHISLSTWFRDYLYIPLGGNRGTRWETLRNLGIVMVLAGLWHGASWIFVLWGAYHGALLILYHFPPLRNLAPPKEDRFSWRWALAVPLMWGFTMVGWAIFRSPSLEHLGAWFAALGNWHGAGLLDWHSSLTWLLIHAVPLVLLQLLTWKYQDETGLAKVPWVARGVIYAVLVLLVVSSSQHDTEFIYFQF